MANILVVSWSAIPFTKTASAFLAEDLKIVLPKHNVIVLGEGPDQSNEKGNIFVETELKYKGKGKRFLKTLRWLKLSKATSKIDKVINDNKIDQVIGIFPDEIFIYAAYKAALKNNIPFTPWFHNTYIENRNGLDLILAKNVQSKIFNSKNVLVISDGLKEFYQEKYPKVNFQVLRHFLPFPQMNFEEKTPSEKITFFFVGTINDSNLDATRYFCNAIKGEVNIELRISTSVPEATLRNNGVLNDNVKYLGFVEDLNKEYEKSDFMLLTHGFTGGFSETEYKTIFPTKTVEMLRSDKPIFAISPENTFLTAFLREKNCCVLNTKKDKNALLKKIKESHLDSKMKSEIVSNAKSTFELFSIKNAEKSFEKFLDL